MPIHRPAKLWVWFGAIVVGAAGDAAAWNARHRLATIAVASGLDIGAWNARKRLPAVVVGTPTWNGTRLRAFQGLVDRLRALLAGIAHPDA